MELRNRVAIVTGSGGPGSGRAEALRLAREGSCVVVSDIDVAGGQQTVSEIQAAGGRAAFFRADVAVEAEVQALVRFSEQVFGGVDILVNNASAPYHPEAPLEYWLQTVQVDLLGAMYGVRHTLDALRRRGGGCIINVGSTSALGQRRSTAPAYDAAKAGVMRLTSALAWLGEREAIRVNCIVPDWVATPDVKAYWDALTPQQREQKKVPAVLTGLDEIADAVVELVTNETLHGRVMVLWSGQTPRLVPIDDAGYARLE